MGTNLTSKKESKLTGVFFKMDKEAKRQLKMYCAENSTNITDVIMKGIGIVTKN